MRRVGIAVDVSEHLTKPAGQAITRSAGADHDEHRCIDERTNQVAEQ